ncbi:MAG TPA: hypothetical protein VKB09_05970 [Thermomicrobiales bacterium]|nr:hypothetical protein [Thermomicrobiales bacterium]
MVQRIGAQYLVKRVTDYVMAPPTTTAEPETEQPQASAPAVSGPDLDGEEIRDDDGQRVGTARRLRDVAVYVVSDRFGDPVEVLHQCLDDPQTRVMFHTVDGRLTGLIYVPDPSKAPPRAGGMRADEV